MVTVYLDGPTKASRWLSPLTVRALGLKQVSWHTTLAADIMGAGSQLGVEGYPEQTQTCPRLQEPAQGPGHQSTKTPRAPGTSRITGSPEPGEIPKRPAGWPKLWWPQEGQMPLGGLTLCWSGAQVVLLE